ncbi:unnamed protein product, partial [Ectocarpus fasciculatus]
RGQRRRGSWRTGCCRERCLATTPSHNVTLAIYRFGSAGEAERGTIFRRTPLSAYAHSQVVLPACAVEISSTSQRQPFLSQALAHRQGENLSDLPLMGVIRGHVSSFAPWRSRISSL